MISMFDDFYEGRMKMWVSAWEWTQMIRSLKRFIQNTDSFTNETQLQRMRSSVAVITVNVALHLNRFLNKIVTRLQCINIFGTEIY